MAPLWCDLGFIPNGRGNKAAANLRPIYCKWIGTNSFKISRISHSCTNTCVDTSIPSWCTNSQGWVIPCLSQVSSDGPKDIPGITLPSVYTLYIPQAGMKPDKQSYPTVTVTGINIPDGASLELFPTGPHDASSHRDSHVLSNVTDPADSHGYPGRCFRMYMIWLPAQAQGIIAKQSCWTSSWTWTATWVDMRPSLP